nr:4-(cytidine 5'-diphospho)-2-C-methyl-D-erythritol kinase [Deinobacterium chartae]
MRRFAPAKINLGLAVTGRRADGYHTLHTLMVPLDVGDHLEVEAAAGLSLEVMGADLPRDRGNLVYRAAEAYLEAAGHPGGAALRLIKRLPLASGLGGGSSDAAAALLALAELYPTGPDLPALAARLGADVPFFLVGGPALAQGMGEILTPLELPPLHVVLVNSGVQVSAADAYRWRSGAFGDPLHLEALLEALHAGRALPYRNDLEPGVRARHPELAAVFAALEDSGLHSPLLSGSGGTCFALARTREAALQAAGHLAEAHPGWWVRAARVHPGPART